MTEQQLAAVKQALEALDGLYLPGELDRVNKAITALQSIISQDALDKMAENARELGLSYDTPLSSFVRSSDEAKAEVMERVIDKATEEQKAVIGCVNHDCDKCKAVQEPVAWPCVIAEADFEQNTITLEMKCSDYKVGAGQHWLHTTPPAPQPVPVKTYHDGKPWPVAPKPWVGLTDEEVMQTMSGDWTSQFYFARAIEAKLREKNT
jgi:hypothetical protein